MNTLAKIACGISDNLPTRIAAVALKEQKKLLLAPREMPFSAIALENMHKLAALGVIIAPPVMGYYADIRTIEEMERFIIGKWYDALGIANNLYQRWKGSQCNYSSIKALQNKAFQHSSLFTLHSSPTNPKRICDAPRHLPRNLRPHHQRPLRHHQACLQNLR
jgi:hypothetical protein